MDPNIMKILAVVPVGGAIVGIVYLHKRFKKWADDNFGGLVDGYSACNKKGKQHG